MLAAKELLWRLGYEAMSPKRLLAESGAGQGSLYHHFSGKKAVALAALEEIEGELTAEMSALLDAPAEPMAGLRAFLLAPRRGAHGCRMGRLVNETAFDDFSLRAPLERFFAEMERRLSGKIRAAQEAGDIDPSLDAERLATVLQAAVQGGYTLSRARRDDAPLREACAGAWALLAMARPAGAETGA